MSKEDRLLQLLRLGLGLDSERDSDFSISQDEWPALFNQLRDHALLGIGFAGLQRLENPNIPKPLLLKWIATTEQIKRRNLQMDKAVADLSRQLEQDGWQFCILKGQTVARLYPQPELRQSGDIDVWIYGKKDHPVEACTLETKLECLPSDIQENKNHKKSVRKPSRREIIRYLESSRPGEHSLKCNGRRVKLCYLHADGLTINGNVSVEVHFLPSFSVSPFKNRKLQLALKETFSSAIPAAKDDFHAAPFAFNRLYMLHHIYRHLFSEGIGLRQVVDYAMLLSRSHAGADAAFCKTLNSLGMLAFAQGIAWILTSKLRLTADCLFCVASEAEGRRLLDSIMRSGSPLGNAAAGKPRAAGGSRTSRWQRFAAKSARNVRFLRKQPGEVLWFVPFAIWETLAYKLPHK